MNSYGIEFHPADDLQCVSQESTSHYRYKNVDFLFKPKTGAKKLLVIMHGSGSIGRIQLPIFRGHDWDYENINILCLGDGLLEMHKAELILTWYLSTSKHNFLKTYQEIIQAACNLLKINDPVFFGSSGGGFPAIVFASIFKSQCIISNSQIYLEKFFDHLVKIQNAVEENQDFIMNISIEKYLVENGFPGRIDYLQNLADSSHAEQHYRPFLDFCKKNNYQNIHAIEYNESERPGCKDAHSIIFPRNTWVHTFII